MSHHLYLFIFPPPFPSQTTRSLPPEFLAEICKIPLYENLLVSLESHSIMSSGSSAQAKALAAAAARRGQAAPVGGGNFDPAALSTVYQSYPQQNGQQYYPQPGPEQAAAFQSSYGQQYSQYSQYSQQGQVAVPTQGREITKEVPVCSFDVRTVLIPKTISETYIIQETRMVAIQIPVTYTRAKEIRVPREISIPRPIVEKRLVRKMVPKVIQVEEQYEIEVALTQLKTFFTRADTNNDNRLSYQEWAAANQGKDETTIKAEFVSSSRVLST